MKLQLNMNDGDNAFKQLQTNEQVFYDILRLINSCSFDYGTDSKKPANYDVAVSYIKDCIAEIKAQQEKIIIKNYNTYKSELIEQ